MLFYEILAKYPTTTPPHNHHLSREIHFFKAHLKPDTILSIPAVWLEPDYLDEGIQLISLGLILGDPPSESSETRQFWQSKQRPELLLSLTSQNNQLYWPNSALYRLGSAVLRAYTKV